MEAQKFICEPSKSDRAKCAIFGCSKKIDKGELRLGAYVQSKKFDGTEKRWYHVKCFLKKFEGKINSVQQFGGFALLRSEEQERLRNLIAGPEIENQGKSANQEGGKEPLAKKIKTEDEIDGDLKANLLKIQQDEFYALYDQLKSFTKKEDWVEILKHNYQYIPLRKEEKLFHVADVIFFGRMLWCENCNRGSFVFQDSVYKCKGCTDLAKCGNTVRVPKRSPAIIPKSLRKAHAFLQTSFGTRDRLLETSASDTVQPGPSSTQEPLVELNSNQVERVSPARKRKRYVVQNGEVVDPRSGLVDIAHVYTMNNRAYNEYLINTEVSEDKNSYYKIQLLESNGCEKNYWIFRSWGRIGTSRGSSRLRQYVDLSAAKMEFRRLFLQFTGNYFGEEFKKEKGKYNRAEIDYNDGIESAKTTSTTRSKLSKPVQHLVQLLFSKSAMKHMILTFSLDLNKMPLGKLSEKTLNEGVEVLEKISKMIENGSTPFKFEEESNKFYRLVPHNFGEGAVRIIDSQAELEQRIEMIDCLRNIKLTFKFLNEVNGRDIHPTDFNYQHLKTNIEKLDSNSDEFKLLMKYKENGEDKSDNFRIKVENIYKVARHGEDDRFEPYAKFDNRQLLWHGSKLTNFPSILSNGLAISPSGIPSSGENFGKGLYFADMLHKSAQYCFAEKTNNIALALLCQVALGKSEEYFERNDKAKLRAGYHSVKGIGKTQPNPDQMHTRDDGVKIPIGELHTNSSATSFDHNEYVIYEEAQAKLEYIFELKFSDE